MNEQFVLKGLGHAILGNFSTDQIVIAGISLDCKTVVFFANTGDRQYANARRSGAARIALTAFRTFRKRPKTTVLQSSIS